MVRVHAHALDVALEAQEDRVGRNRLRQPDQERIAERRLVLEAVGVIAELHLREHVAVVGLALGHGAELDQLGGDDRQLLRRREDARLVRLGSHGGDLRRGRDAHDLRLGAGEPERDVGSRGGRREERHADQLEELHVVPVRHAVQPVDELVRHPGEGLDQRHARIGDVVVSPLGAALLDESLGLVDEVLEPTIVKIRNG